MRLQVDSLQAQLARSVRAVLRAGGDPWPALADLGVLRLAVPADRDGLDLGTGAAIMAATEFGRALQPVPGYRETAAALGVLAAAEPAGGPASAHRAARPEHSPAEDDPAAHDPAALLAAALDGRRRLAVLGLWGGTPAVRLDAAGRLWGGGAALPAAPWGGAVVLAQRDGGEVFAFAPECSWTPVDTLSGPAVLPEFRGAAATVLAVKDPAGTAAAVRAQALVGQAAFLRGVAEAALVAARDRVSAREQFGRPLIEKQSISHRLAALAAELEGVDMLVHAAAWHCDHGSDPGPAPTQALAAAAETALHATRLTIQLHGARGMLAGSVAEQGYRLATVEAVRLGTPAQLWTEAGQLRWAAWDAAA